MKNLLALLLYTLLLQSALSQAVVVQYLANEGVKISSPKGQILVDALFDQEFEAFDFLPADTLEQILREKDIETIILASHIHGDHFNASLTGKALLQNPKRVFISPKETGEQFRQQFEAYDEVSSSVRSASLRMHQRQAFDFDWVKITAIRLEHMGDSPWKEAENFAYMIELEGTNILHLGDARIDAKNLEALNAKSANIDVAILPFGQMVSSEQKQLIDTLINTRQIFAAHIPLKYYDQADSLLSELGYLNTTCLISPLKSFSLAPAN